jgi:hypothetical protein
MSADMRVVMPGPFGKFRTRAAIAADRLKDAERHR